MQRLIINADDYGDSKAINAGILQAHEAGSVTSTTILANGKHFEEAINHLPKSLGLGIHLNLSYGKALTTKKRLDPKLQYKMILGKVNLRFAEQELRAQIQKVQDRGIKITHFDSHQNIHAFQPLTSLTIKLANEFKVKKIRWPKEKAPFQLSKSYAKQTLINRQLKHCPLTTTDHFFGLVHTGKPSMRTFLSYLKFQGTAELCCHPSQTSLAKRDKFSRSRTKELKILCHPRFTEAIQQRGIKLISFKEL